MRGACVTLRPAVADRGEVVVVGGSARDPCWDGCAAIGDGHVSVLGHRGLDEAALRARRHASRSGVGRAPACLARGIHCAPRYEVDCEGDSFFVAFASAREAVSAAGEAQAALADGPVRVRMGLHTGEALLMPPRYVRLDVHRAARVMAVAHGGQVLVSQATQAVLDEQVRLRDLGEHRLKDIAAQSASIRSARVHN
jgi:class 3 adenylate cyclase